MQFTNLTLSIKKLGSLQTTGVVVTEEGHYETHIEYLKASRGFELMLAISGPGK